VYIATSAHLPHYIRYHLPFFVIDIVSSIQNALRVLDIQVLTDIDNSFPQWSHGGV
jgi:hypothetical protein